MRRGHSRIAIDNATDYNEVIGDMLDEFLDDFPNLPGMMRLPDEDDYSYCDDNVGLVFTPKGSELYARACRRYRDLGLKYFHEEDLDIKARCIIEW